MIERFHRTPKAALMCHKTSWPKLLPSVMLGLRTVLKEEIGASPAELLYGATIRIPGDFVVQDNRPVEKGEFLKQLRDHFNILRPTPASKHAKQKPFISKDLLTCTHVFVKYGQIRK